MGCADSSGRPDRTPEEIAGWAKDHDLPFRDDGRVRFPDARIEFEDRDGLEQHRDIEVVTPHYWGATRPPWQAPVSRAIAAPRPRKEPADVEDASQTRTSPRAS